MENQIAEKLKNGLKSLDLYSEELVEKVALYSVLLNKWNRVHNLTAIRDPLEQVSQHYLDCFAIIPFLSDKSQAIVDIGSGAGFPGLMIALARPDCSLYLVESNQKKTAFLKEVKRKLKLNNVEIINQRIENWQPDCLVNVVVSRAVGDVNLLIKISQHLGNPQTSWLMMKSRDNEICTVDGFDVVAIHEVKVPYLQAERILIEIRNVKKAG